MIQRVAVLAILALFCVPAQAREVIYQGGEIAPPHSLVLISPWQAGRRTCDAEIKTQGEYAMKYELDMLAAGESLQVRMYAPLRARDFSEATHLLADVRFSAVLPEAPEIANIAGYAVNGAWMWRNLQVEDAGEWRTLELPLDEHPGGDTRYLAWALRPDDWLAAGVERVTMHIDNVRLLVPDEGVELPPLRPFSLMEGVKAEHWHLRPEEWMTQEMTAERATEGERSLKVTFVPRGDYEEHGAQYMVRGYGQAGDWTGYDALEMDVWFSHVLPEANEVYAVPVNTETSGRPWLPGFNVIEAEAWQHVRLPFPKPITEMKAIDIQVDVPSWAARYEGETITAFIDNVTITRGGAAQPELPVEVPAPVPPLAEEPTAAESERGFQLFSRSWLETVYLSSPPLPTDEREELRLFACPGEYEPVTVSIRPLRDLPSAKISVSELRSEAGTLPAGTFEVRVADTIPVALEANTFRRLPILLNSGARIEPLPAGHTRRLWLTAHVPEDARPGTYRGAVTVSAGAETVQMPLTLRVLPIELQEPDIAFQIYYQYDWRHQGFGYVHPENYALHFADMREHGLNGCTVSPTPSVVLEDGRLVIDWFQSGNHWLQSPQSPGELLDGYVAAGLTSPVPWIGAGSLFDVRPGNSIAKLLGTEEYSDAWVAAYRQIVEDLERMRAERGWPEVLYYLADEPANSEERTAEARRRIELLRDIPGTRSLVTTHTVGLQTAQRYLEILDINQVHASQVYDGLREQVIEAGNSFWTYNGMGADGARSPMLGRTYYGVFAWLSGSGGISQWIYQGPGSPNPFDQRYERQYFYAYPSEEGPIPTPGWEGIREGIDDYRYALTLARLIERAEDAGRNDLAAAGREALESLPSTYDMPDEPERNAGYVAWRSGLTPGTLHGWRWRMAEQIMALQEALQ